VLPWWSSLLSLDRVWLVTVVALTFAAANGFPVDQTDYWWTVKLGDLLWVSGQLPTADALTFTATRQPYVEQQWLAQLILAAVHRLGGLEAALLLRAGLLAAAMGLLFHTCYRVCGRAALAALATLAALPLVLPGAATRPQLLVIPFFVLFLTTTILWLDRPWVLVALPLTMVVWVNVHGSFTLGLALLAIAVVGRGWSAPWRRDTPVAGGPHASGLGRPTLALALCLLAVLANPYGIGIVPWLIDFVLFHSGGPEASVMATEWLPTSLAERAGALYFASVLVVLSLLIRSGPPPVAHTLRLLAFGLLALLAVRSGLWWALVMAPALAWALAAPPRTTSRPPAPAVAAPSRLGISPAPASRTLTTRTGVLHAALLVALLFAAAASLPSVRDALGVGGPIADPSQPRAAGEYLAGLDGPRRLLNYADWGGYLAWRLAPQSRVFVDGRFGIYPPSVYRDYFRVSSAGQAWDTTLDAHAVDGLVLSRGAQADLLAALAAHPAWRRVYCDPLAAVYVRAAAATGEEAACSPA
jgi:hypothetical protein